MKTTHLLFIACCLFIAACGSHSKNQLEFNNDLENVKGWASGENNAQTVIKGIARSGDYLSKTDTNHRFGFIFRSKLSDIADKKMKNVKVAAWVTMQELNSEAILVVIVDSANKTVVWEAQKLGEVVKEKNKWTEVIVSADLSNTHPTPDYVISFYVWNTGNTPVFSDDHRIRFYE